MQLQCGLQLQECLDREFKRCPQSPLSILRLRFLHYGSLLRQVRSLQLLKPTGKRQHCISSQSLISEKRGRLLPSHSGNSPGQSMDWPGPDHVPILEPITEPGGKESADCSKRAPLGTLEKSNGSCWSGLRMGLTLESCSVARKKGAGKVCLAL